MMSVAVAPDLSSVASNCTPQAYFAVAGISCSLSAAVWYACIEAESLSADRLAWGQLFESVRT